MKRLTIKDFIVKGGQGFWLSKVGTLCTPCRNSVSCDCSSVFFFLSVGMFLALSSSLKSATNKPSSGFSWPGVLPNFPANTILCKSFRLLHFFWSAWAISAIITSLQQQLPHLYAPPSCVPLSNCQAGASPQKNLNLSVTSTPLFEVTGFESSIRHSARSGTTPSWCSGEEALGAIMYTTGCSIISWRFVIGFL